MTSPKIETGTDVLRAALYARSRKLHPANLARDLGVSAAALDSFSNGKGNLTTDVLKKLTLFLFQGHGVYDETIDRIRPAVEADPTLLGVHSPRAQRTTAPPASYKAGPQPVIPRPAPPAKVQRPGWVVES